LTPIPLLVSLRSERPLVVGHRGAAAHALENTLASLERAVELGADLVEFDVLSLDDGALVLAHSDDLVELSHGRASGRVGGLGLHELRAFAPELATFDEAVGFLAERAPAVGAHVDLKSPGVEEGIVEALRRRGLFARAIVSSCETASLRRLAALEPAVTRALTYPCDRRRLGGRRAAAPFRSAVLRGLRAALPRRIGGMLRGAEATVASLHWSVVSRAAVDRAHLVDAAVFVWTVNDETVLESVLAAGVDGVITDDPAFVRATLTP
jgi:glycerophosphoryl diester phosphodiesterase